MSVSDAQFIGDHESENRIEISQIFIKIFKILLALLDFFSIATPLATWLKQLFRAQ